MSDQAQVIYDFFVKKKADVKRREIMRLPGVKYSTLPKYIRELETKKLIVHKQFGWYSLSDKFSKAALDELNSSDWKAKDEDDEKDFEPDGSDN